uniref:Uncharacterized protein n=1 Tax=Tetranychus urticae TaxID=32264 RepID=T1KY92_TETUR
MATNSTSITRITTVEEVEEPVARTSTSSEAAHIDGYYDVEKFTHCFRAVRNYETHAELWAVARWKTTPLNLSAGGAEKVVDALTKWLNMKKPALTQVHQTQLRCLGLYLTR